MKALFLLICLFLSATAFSDDRPPVGSAVWFEIRVSEFEKAESFYSRLFGWTFQEIFPGYKMISLHDEGIGGLTLQKSKTQGGQGTMTFFRVENLKSSFTQALSFGATQEQEPMDIEGYGSYAIIRDLDNNQIALFSEKSL